jgi:hypothetical protein
MNEPVESAPPVVKKKRKFQWTDKKREAFAKCTAALKAKRDAAKQSKSST